MAYDGLRKTDELFNGVRYVVRAHYGKITDYKEERHDSYTDALKAGKVHRAKGANVTIYSHRWIEVYGVVESLSAWGD